VQPLRCTTARCSTGRMCRAIFARARASCALTVPCGTPRIRAVSKIERPSTIRSWNVLRKVGDSSAVHFRKRAVISKFRNSSSGLGRSSASPSYRRRGCASELLDQQEMNLAWSFAQLHQSAVADNRRQPKAANRASCTASSASPHSPTVGRHGHNDKKPVSGVTERPETSELRFGGRQTRALIVLCP
jgi:hypothetical protein